MVLTDQETFPYVLQHMGSSARIAKWVIELQEFDYSFVVEDSTRASLADVLTYRDHEKRVNPKPRGPPPITQQQSTLEDAHVLHFDGAYRKKTNQAASGIVIHNPHKELVVKQGQILSNIHSNNEAEYASLVCGLKCCLDQGIKRLEVKGDAMLIIKQVQGIWACKNSNLLSWLK